MIYVILGTMIGILLILLFGFIISFFFASVGGIFGQKSRLSMEDTIKALKDERSDRLARIKHFRE